MIVRYDGHAVSDPAVRQVLAAIADALGRVVRVTSGDRDFVPPGGARHSDHLRHRAADFHLEGLDDADGMTAIRAATRVFPSPMAFQLIRHGRFTQTQGAHLHLGHPGAESPRAGFWTEGLSAAARGVYTRLP